MPSCIHSGPGLCAQCPRYIHCTWSCMVPYCTVLLGQEVGGPHLADGGPPGSPQELDTGKALLFYGSEHLSIFHLLYFNFFNYSDPSSNWE